MVATGSLPALVKAKLTILLFMTCSLKSAGIGSRNGSFHNHSLSPPIAIVLAKDFFFFFSHMEALKACPPQQNSKHYLVSNSNFLSIRKCFKAFLSSRTRKSILSDICIEHRNSARPILLIERKSKKKKKVIKIP